MEGFKEEVCIAYIWAIKDLYEYDGVISSVRTQGVVIDDFPITLRLHQGSTLSSYPFTLVFDMFTKHIQEATVHSVYKWYNPNRKVEKGNKWEFRAMETLEVHVFCISRSKSMWKVGLTAGTLFPL